MTRVEQPNTIPPSAIRFTRAKAEHYLQLAESHIRCARYYAARETARVILGLDPENSAGKSLERRIALLIDQVTRVQSSSRDGEITSEMPKRKRQRNELVLIVDQDEQLVETIVEQLQMHGLRAISAGSYAEALEVLSSMTPDLIISEVNFANGPAGFDLYLWVRTNAERSEIPFLFLATRVDRETLIAGKRLGVDEFLNKPPDIEVLLASILNCLSRRKKLLTV